MASRHRFRLDGGTAACRHDRNAKMALSSCGLSVPLSMTADWSRQVLPRHSLAVHVSWTFIRSCSLIVGANFMYTELKAPVPKLA